MNDYPLLQAIQANDSLAIGVQCAAIVAQMDPAQEHGFFTQVSQVSHTVAIDLKIEENRRKENGEVPSSAADQYDSYQRAMTEACAARMGPAGLSEPQAKALALALASQRRHAEATSPTFKAAAKTLGEALQMTTPGTTPSAAPARMSARPR